MKRKLKWLAIVLAVSLLAFGTALLLWPRDRITAESWQKIQLGMTEREVAEILGGPGMTPAEELDPFEFEPSLEEPARPIRLVSAKIWYGRRGRIVIDLGQDNLVCWKFFQRGRRINGAILDRLRDWLGW